ncbi:MAG TPA: LuxR C-terminal-related transcriptional regulator [Anaerolineaceae bacterium]|nr:LuxR C-terminal-related transcriptional regulator [Anaerolineaceae bacterium]
MNDGLDGKATLISASTGFGKTTIVSEWVRQSGRSTAWLSLDDLDNDPLRFLTYFIRAIQNIKRGFGEAILESLNTTKPNSRFPGRDSFLEALISEIAEITAPFILALDDYHVITASEIQDMLLFFLNNLPENMHVVISTRADPPWPLGRMRARREINEVRASDLRFTMEESAVFLNEQMGLNLAEQDIAILDSRTEGWIAGLQLAALSMRGQSNKHQFIENLAGSNRFISDYLVEEVLEKQPPALQEFLLKTSILDQLNAGLCDQLTGRSDSQAVLLHLEQSNLFLQSLDNDRYWYRYHHLFADLLRIKFKQTQSAQVPALHRCASQWFEKNKLITEAVSHALAASDFEQVVRLVKGSAFSMLDTGELSTLVGWLDALPRQLILSEPWMSVFYAWALAYTGQLNSAEEHLINAESALMGAQKDNTQPNPEHLLGHIATIRVLIAKNRGEMSRAIDLAQEALKYLPEQDYKTRCYVAQTLGNALLFIGKMDAATQAFQSAVSASQKANDINRAVYALCDLSGLQWMLGQLCNAEASCREALRLAERNVKDGGLQSPGAGFAYARRSRILLEWDDGEAALRHAEQGLALSQRRGQADVMFFCLVTLAEVQFSNKDVPGSLATFHKAMSRTTGGASWHAAMIDQFETEVRFGNGDIIAAERWLQKMGWKVGDEVPEGQVNAFEFIARILIAKREYVVALNLLDILLVREQAKGVMVWVLFIQITQALAWYALGNTEQALVVLDRALTQAEPEGYIRSFTDRGAPIRPLLQEAAERGMHVPYVNRLLAVFGDTPEPVISSVKPCATQLNESFSEREMEVLRLLDTDLAAPDIASKLMISTHTVRSHIKNLYRKLNAHSRYEAVIQARDLHLL